MDNTFLMVQIVKLHIEDQTYGAKNINVSV